MENILDSIDNEAQPIPHSVRLIEYTIYLLNGLALFLFLISYFFYPHPKYVDIYFFSLPGVILLISQFELLYIYFWNKSFQKYQLINQTFKAYSLGFKLSQFLLLIWGIFLFLSAIFIFYFYFQASFKEEVELFLFIIGVNFLSLGLLYVYYNIQTKRLSNNQ